MISPENYNSGIDPEVTKEEQYDFHDQLEGPIHKFNLDFGEEAIFDERDPNTLLIHGSANMTSATIQFDETGKILEVNVTGETPDENLLRDNYNAKAEKILKEHANTLGLK